MIVTVFLYPQGELSSVFKNQVTVTQDIEYKAGDYINGDLSDPKNSYSVPRVALDMGLPFKLSAYLFEATEPAN